MLTGINVNGTKVVYDLPKDIKTVEQMQKLIYGYNHNPEQREELQGQPLLEGLCGPMYNGTGTLKKSGEVVAIIRYEKAKEYLAYD